MFKRLKTWYFSASMKKKLAFGIIVLIAVIILFSQLRPRPSLYTFEPVTRETVTDVVTESGNVTSSGRFDVYSTSTGYIENVYVKNGDIVKAGAQLFKVRSTATPQEKAAAYASYQSAVSSQKTAEQAKLTLQALLGKDRQAVLDAQNDVDYKNSHTTNSSTHSNYTDLERQSIDATLENSRQTFSADEKKYLEADTAIAAAKASVSSTWIAYQATKDSVVVAPAPGMVANFSLFAGDKVTASSAATTTPSLVILGDVHSTIKIPLNEVDVNKVAVGQKATIVFDAFREKEYSGHIETIDAAGTNTNGVITYNATVMIDNADDHIKTEMTATVAIQTASHANVLSVPNASVKPYKGGKAVIVEGAAKENQVKNKAGKVLNLHYVPVKVGLKGILRTEILQGVDEQMKVITSSIN